MNRRAFLGASTAVIVAAAGARYLPLVIGDNFEELFADALGVRTSVATPLLAAAHDRLGDLEYDRRAAQFALAVRSPTSDLLPDGIRRRSIASLVDAVITGPPAALAVALDQPPADRCRGLVRDA